MVGTAEIVTGSYFSMVSQNVEAEKRSHMITSQPMTIGIMNVTTCALAWKSGSIMPTRSPSTSGTSSAAERGVDYVVAMGEHRALGLTRGARRVEDRREVVRPAPMLGDVAAARAQIVERGVAGAVDADRVAQARELAARELLRARGVGDDRDGLRVGDRRTQPRRR